MSDELREAASIRITSYQRFLANSYNRRVKPRGFRAGDLVFRKFFENTADPDHCREIPTQPGRTLSCDANR